MKNTGHLVQVRNSKCCI